METCKYSDWTRGQVEALINIIGEENAKDLLAGNFKVNFEEIVKMLFNKHGHRIPEGLKTNVCDPNRNFRLVQPKLETEIDYANRITRLHGCLSVDTEVTAEQLKTETERLLVLIQNNSQIANIANGVYLPMILPKLTTNNIGTILEQYLEAVAKSYVKTFSDRKFYNHRQGTLADNVKIVKKSRYDQLIEKMKQGPVIGIHFPNPLQGFSINASREQMTTLPEGFFLSGLDTVIAMAMWIDILARDYHTPGLDLAAFSWQSADSSLVFWASDDRLGFDYAGNLADANDNYSGGLFFCG